MPSGSPGRISIRTLWSMEIIREWVVLDSTRSPGASIPRGGALHASPAWSRIELARGSAFEFAHSTSGYGAVQ